MTPTPITLPNGLRLLLDEMPGAQSVAVNLCVLSGLRFEQPEQAGISHMMEHMLFKGTQSRTAREIAEQADDRGANLNAYTCKEYTCFYVRSLPEHLDPLLELLADMMHNSRLADGDLDMERGVVLEEIAMYEDLPDELVFDYFYDMVWQDHMLGKNILGTRKSLAALTCGDLRAHLRRLYTPGRMVISVCGKFDAEKTRGQLEALFGQTSMADAAQPETPTAAFSPGLFFARKHVEQNQIVLGFPGCAGSDARRYQASLLSTMLGGSTSSRLFQRLREELGLVYAVDFFNVHHVREGISGVSLGLGEKPQCQALAEVLKILREFPEAVTQQELKRAQEQAAAGLVMSLESGAARASRAACNLLLFDKLTPVEQSIASYRAVTLDEIRAFARELLNPENLALCVLGKITKKAEREMREMVSG